MKRINEWTLIFYLAGDNLLSPGMISQLKAIKDAGFQENTTVLVYFDPGERGAPTRLFEVNRQRKKEKKTQIGDGIDPFVRNLIEDEITEEILKTSKGRVARGLQRELKTPESIGAVESLTEFLNFCVDKRSAQHYMLFLVGHGMIVGNDAFLPDEHPNTAIKLVELGGIMRGFAGKVKKTKGTFELLGLHSCSMSGIEVAYELKDTARYMMATEGVSFVGSWPYRQLLKKFFNTIKRAKAHKPGVDIEELVKKLNNLCLHNGTDFMFAGFSADISLCNLAKAKVAGLNEPIGKLAKALKHGLSDEREKERILLAHWKSQSYWDENYTDLYDFCSCLEKMYDEVGEKDNQIKLACREVRKTLDAPQRSDEFDALVVYSDHFGPTYQYSHGLSIYFPWSEPIADGVQNVLRNYQDYAFTRELKNNSWLSFLEQYFTETRRASREKEDSIKKGGLQKRIKIATAAFDDSITDSNLALTDNAALTKPNPADSGGEACNCASIKNYPRQFSLSQRASKAFWLKNR
jgi:hypothetical protein